MKVPFRPQTCPSPDAQRKLIYKNDLKAAVDRLDTCWNSTQINDVLRSIEYFTEIMKKC